MSYSRYEQNRDATSSVNQVLKTTLVLMEDGLKWLINFIGQMVRQVMGK